MNYDFTEPRAAVPRDAAAPKTRGTAAILGPTNTGKTHFAIERMLGHGSGMIGLPLRLLAREVYQKVAARVGADQVALVTGEEKIKPPNPRYWVATVEAMPRDLDLAFVAVDEIQLAADLDRGHVFTNRLLERRGREETLLIGSGVAAPLVKALLPGAPIMQRPRLSKLTFAGDRKISRLPPRSAIVAFSAEEVYAIAEWIRRQRGGAAVVLGALSPRTRNAQIDMYQAGDVDYIVATDAIGMGLNLDVEHIAFASDTKFDGRMRRRLTLAEMGQIAGRAGRNLRDGTFGTTGRCPPLAEEEIEALEDHAFEPLRILQWRNADLDFSSPEALLRSLDRTPRIEGLTRAPMAEDQLALESVARDPDVRRQAATPADVARLWEACQIPDYRKVSPSAHAELVSKIFFSIVRRQRIAEDWFARQIAQVDRTDGDIDALSQRIAQVRAWSFIANRGDWLERPEHWQGEARRVEDRLSDALHERLAQRFVDRRTSLLKRRLRENAMLEAEITTEGDVLVEGQHVGQLRGFRFTPDPQAEGEAARALNAAAQKALAAEIDARATRVADAVDTAFTLSNDGAIRWLGEPIARIAAGEKVLAPQARVTADERLAGEALEKVQRRVDLWLAQHVAKLLGPLAALESGEGLEGIARGVAFRLSEELGVVERSKIAGDVKSLTQDGRASLRKLGARFGAYHVYLPALLKPAPRALATQLWALKHGGLDDAQGLEDVAHMASSGRTSFAVAANAPRELYRIAGFRVAGERAVRVDILERLADLIRPAIAYRPGVTPGEPPAGAADGSGFVVTVQMTSLCGCSGEAFAAILRSLGFASEMRAGPAITVPLLPAAATEPVQPKADAEEATEVEGRDAAEPQPTPDDAMAEEGMAEDAMAEDAVAAASAEHAVADAAPEAVVETRPDESADLEHAALQAESAPVETAAARLEEQARDAELAPDIEAAPPQTAPDAGASADAASQPGESAPEEPQMIEVWSPHRPQHHRKPDQRRRDQRGKQEQRAPREWRFDKPRPERPKPDEAPRAHGADQETNRDSARPDNRKRFEGKKFEGKKFEGKRFEGGKFGDKKFERRDSGPRTFTSGDRPQRNREPDPNSPFAKLAALKAELEKKK